MKKLITIIIPVFNAEAFIKKNLEKLEQQTLKNFKVILVNDGSKDKTLEKINEFIKETKIDILLINQENKGEGEARNSALKVLNTKYVIFLDCDDYLEKNALEIMYKEIIKEDIDIVCTSYCKVSNKNIILKKIIYIEEILKGEEILKEFLLRNINPGIGNSIVKSEIIKQNKLEFMSYKYGADNLFYREVLLKCKKMKVIDNILFFYVNNPMSVMNQKYNNNREDALKSIEIFKEKYKYYCNINYINVSLGIEMLGLLKLNPRIIFRLNLKKRLCGLSLDILKKHKTYKKYLIFVLYYFPTLFVYIIFVFINLISKFRIVKGGTTKE